MLENMVDTLSSMVAKIGKEYATIGV